MFPSADAYLPGSQFLEHDRTQLNDAQRGLAPSDDGVDTWTVSVVRTDSAVSVAVQRRCIATGTALSLTGDEVDERLDQCLLGGLGVHASQLPIRPGPTLDPGNVVKTHSPEEARPPEAGAFEYASGFPLTQGVKIEK